MSEKDSSSFQWFVVQVVSNQEMKVKRSLENLIEQKNLEASFGDVLVPTKTVVEVKGGKKISKVKKFFPGYVFLHMSLFDENGTIDYELWSLVKNITGVLKFDKPVPLKQDEIEPVLQQLEQVKGKKVLNVEFNVGDTVTIIDGPFFNLNGKIEEIDQERCKLKVSVSIFGRFTPVELEYWQVKQEEN